MRRVAPSVLAHEDLHRLLAGGADRGANIVSALVETVTRLVVQDLVEGEQADFLGGRGRYERRGEGQRGSRNGYERGRVRTAEGAIEVAIPQVRGAGEPFHSTVMSFLWTATPTCSSGWSWRCMPVGCRPGISRTRSETSPVSC